MPALEPAPAAPPPAAMGQRRWLRLVIIQVLQLPALALVVVSDRTLAWWVAALWASAVCCAGTDSGWRWINRALVLQAVAWLVVASLFGTSALR